jgi:hypothetical protein
MRSEIRTTKHRTSPNAAKKLKSISQINFKLGVDPQLSGPWKTTLVLTSEPKVYFRGEENNPQLPKLKMF